MTNTPKPTSHHLPGLNSIRAIAAVAVLVCHIDQQIGRFSNSLSSYISQFDIQGYAVTLFFVLSGFLITLLLIKERNNNGGINLKNFYIRRILKIGPLYFLIITLTTLVSIFFPNYFWLSNNENYIYYFLFVGNIAFITEKTFLPIMSFWSIGVEEQFYIFWPFIIKRENIIKGLNSFLIVFCVLKIALRIFDNSFAYWLILETKFSCMAIGGIGAYLIINNH